MSDQLEKDYSEIVHKLAKPGEDIKRDITARQLHWIHMAMGICGEAGELMDAVKKATIYGKPIDMMNVVEELGDLEWYLEGLRASLGLRRDDILEFNIRKLSKRYETGTYSNEQAQRRADKELSDD